MREEHYDQALFCQHQQEHQNFIDSVLQEKINCAMDPDRVTAELLNFLLSWLADHILNSDKQMVLTITGVAPNTSAESSTEILYSALRESETRFRNLADSLPAFIWISD